MKRFEPGAMRAPGRCAMMLYAALLLPLDAVCAEQSADQVWEESIFDILNGTHDYWSELLVDYAGRFDRFFGDDRNFEETNESVVQIDLDEVMKRGGSHDLSLGARAKLALPQLEHRLHLLVETDPEQVATGEKTEEGPVLPRDVTSRDSYSTALRYQKETQNIWHFSADAGVRLSSGLTPYTRARGSVSIPMGMWRMKLAETLFWFKTIGTGETTRMDLEHIITGSLLFRSASNATWLNDERSLTLRQDLAVYHTVDARNALVYQLSAIGTTQPLTEMTDYVALVRYRHRLHRDWLFAEVSPQLHYPLELDYHHDPQLILRLEMLFGG